MINITLKDFKYFTGFSLFFIGNLVVSEGALAARIDFSTLNIPLKVGKMNMRIPNNPLGIIKNVVKSTEADDYLLWVSDKVTVNGQQTENEFRIWGLEKAEYYALTYGVNEDEPGVIIGFCGYNLGVNEAWADPMNGSSSWINLEPINREPVQGEVPESHERFQFNFKAAANLDNKSLLITHTAPPPPLGGKGHRDPVSYNPKNLTHIGVTKETTISNIYGGLENGEHKWNPKIPPCLRSITPQQCEDLPLEQPEFQPVPEPLTILGAGTAAGFGAFFKREINKKKKGKKDSEES